MSHPLEPVLALQKKDRRLLKVLREIRDIPQRRNDIEAQLSGSKQRLEQAQDGRNRIEVSLKDIELEVESLKEQITKYKQQQMDAQTNDQYRAFIREIGTIEEQVKQLEEREIELLEELERVKAAVEECEARLDTEKEGISDELAELDEREAELREQLEKMKADRVRSAAQVDKEILQRYTRIMNNKKDFGLVLVESGGHCSGCHMKLPPQVIHDARNPTKLVACNFCGRIVYNPPNR